jgi:hypothetical protein
LVERLVRDQEAVGSNPTSPINRLERKYFVAEVSKKVRRPRCNRK